MLNSDDNITFDSHVDLQAAAGSEGKPPRVSIMAYSGDFISPPGWPNTIIDLAGLEIPATVPLCAEHDESLGGMIGSGVATITAATMSVLGTLADTPRSTQIVNLSKGGLNLSASVGVRSIEPQTSAARRDYQRQRKKQSDPKKWRHVSYARTPPRGFDSTRRCRREGDRQHCSEKRK